MSDSKRSRKCLVTKIGLVLLLAAFGCFATILIIQRVRTGSFARGNGFVFGKHLADPMFVTLIAGLLTLLVGGVVDAVRFQRWKKGLTQGDAAA